MAGVLGDDDGGGGGGGGAGARGLGVVPAAALLELGLVAVGHFCLRDGAAPPRWFGSLAEAITVYGKLGGSAATAAQWEETMEALRARRRVWPWASATWGWRTARRSREGRT